jgi:hypothetical protein
MLLTAAGLTDALAGVRRSHTVARNRLHRSSEAGRLFELAPRSSNKLRARFSPHTAPRFQSDFDGLSGVIYHLGNSDLKVRDEGAYFAYELLSDSSRGAEPPSSHFIQPCLAT